MTSGEERREVAAMLRERERGWRKIGIQINVKPDRPATNFENIAALLGFSGWILYADVFARLADLIDPTCEVKDDNRWTSDFAYVCAACGEHFSTCDKPKYCPGCGARVVDE